MQNLRAIYYKYINGYERVFISLSFSESTPLKKLMSSKALS